MGFHSNVEESKLMQLNTKEQAIIPIAAFTASGDLARLKASINQGLNLGLSIIEIREVLQQMYAYAGFPRSLNGLGTLLATVTERKVQGLTDDLGVEASPFPEGRRSFELGRENQTQLVGRPVTGELFEFSPEIDRYLKAHLFGDIFQRDILSWKVRELATIAALANIHGVNSQLRSHYLISMNNGVTSEQLNEFIQILQEECGEAIALNAKQVLQEALA